MGLYASILSLTQAVAGMGINSSGVRQIAEAVGSAETMRIARTASVLRRSSILLGLLGALLCSSSLGPCPRSLSAVTTTPTPSRFSLLAVLLQHRKQRPRSPASGPPAHLGSSQDWDARCPFRGTLTAIALVYCSRTRGSGALPHRAAGASLLFSWWFSRRVTLNIPALSTAKVGQEAGTLLKLGLAFMASGMLIMGSAYMIRVIIVRRDQSLGSRPISVRMGHWWVVRRVHPTGNGGRLYPRLTAVVQQRDECNRLVNEQGQVSMLLAARALSRR